MDSSYNNGLGAQIPQGDSQNNFQQPIVSSGTGDIVLNDGSGKKSRKRVVILVILVTLFVLVGGGILIWRNGAFEDNSDNGGQIQAGTLEEKYNNYVNYILYGEDNIEEPDIKNVSEIAPYFEELDNDSLADYLKKTSNLFTNFEQAYNAEIDEYGVDLTPLTTYYYDYAEKQPLQDDALLNMYVTSGKEESDKRIDSEYIADGVSGKYYDYLNAIRSYYHFYLGLIEKIDIKGCIKDEMVLSGCFTVNDEDKKTIENEAVKVFNLVEEMRTAAINTVKDVYAELYGELPSDNGLNREEDGDAE